MSDSLVLSGESTVKKHTGSEMALTRDKRGGVTHQLKEWWRGNSANTCYGQFTVFNVTTEAGTVKLVLGSSRESNVRVDHDGSFNFVFYGMNNIRRAALFTADFELIEHYVFPSISGGKTMVVTPANAATRPVLNTPKKMGIATITGSQSPDKGATETYSVSVSGDAGNLSYVWSVNKAGSIKGKNTDSTVKINWTKTTDSTIMCVVTSADKNVTDGRITSSFKVSPV